MESPPKHSQSPIQSESKSIHQAMDLNTVRRIPFAQRETKVAVSQFGKPAKPNASFNAFLDGLPDFLGASDLKALVELTARCIQQQQLLLVMMGAHVIKTGLAPWFIQLLKKRAIGCISIHGAVAIHDVEIALFGRTSEEVSDTLQTGLFGFIEETPRFIHQALQAGQRDGLGYGESLGRALAEATPPHGEHSLLLAAYQQGVPVTVHAALGTETIHQHPEADGALMGAASMRDFQVLCQQLTRLENGVALLFGSAVILPEVFLKALTVARNTGHHVECFTTANFDMIRHYRPQTNLVARPTQKGGRGFSFVGQHEILIPLFWQAVMETLG